MIGKTLRCGDCSGYSAATRKFIHFNDMRHIGPYVDVRGRAHAGRGSLDHGPGQTGKSLSDRSAICTVAWWVVNRRSIGWRTAFRRRGPAKAGTPTSQMKSDEALVQGTKLCVRTEGVLKAPRHPVEIFGALRVVKPFAKCTSAKKECRIVSPPVASQELQL
jgi:hypothetical protein